MPSGPTRSRTAMSTTHPASAYVLVASPASITRPLLEMSSGRHVSIGMHATTSSTAVDAANGAASRGYLGVVRLTTIALPNGVTSTLMSDITDRLTRRTHVEGAMTLEDIQYVLNAAGNRTSMTNSAGTTSWTYDDLDRWTNVSEPNGDTVAYGYDAVGNRTSHTINGVPKTNTFDLANRMTASGSDSYTFDANGNQTSKTSGGTTTTYSYDALNRRTGISGPVSAGYSESGDGLRVRTVLGGATTDFTWDALGLPVIITNEASMCGAPA
jgi:YD repeat-containing protein